jgi:hypothetical protein
LALATDITFREAREMLNNLLRFSTNKAPSMFGMVSALNGHFEELYCGMKMADSGQSSIRDFFSKV